MPKSKVTWDAFNCMHLLRRAGDGFTYNEFRWAQKAGHKKTVRAILSPSTFKPRPFSNYKDIKRRLERPWGKLDFEERQELQKDMRMEVEGLLEDWVIGMTQSRFMNDALLHKMAFFWHSLFVVEAQKVRNPVLIYDQISLFYKYALGNYADLLKEMVRNPALIMYLDNQRNRKSHPNENFAREIMELFSLGRGNYSEEDIKEGARALTGYSVKHTEFQFKKNFHDFGKKHILGVSGNWDGEEFIEIILDQPACSEYIARRIWGYFAGTEASEELTQELAGILRKNKYEVKPLLYAIFTHPEFYSTKVKGRMIKSPMSFTVGFTRQFNVDLSQPNYLKRLLRNLGQLPYHAPNVKGWPGGRTWIDTSRLTTRQAFTAHINSLNKAYKNDMEKKRAMKKMKMMGKSNVELNILKAFPVKESDTVPYLNYLNEFIFAVPLNSNQITKLSKSYPRRLDDSGKQTLFLAMLELPNYQLM